MYVCWKRGFTIKGIEVKVDVEIRQQEGSRGEEIDRCGIYAASNSASLNSFSFCRVIYDDIKRQWLLSC